MRRFIFAFCFLPCPSLAWEFRADPVCTLSHETDAAQIIITYDASKPLYSLQLTLKAETWQPSDRFGVLFAGPLGLTIGTNRHEIEGATLTVTDSGFGNVLNGLQYNKVARAFTDHQSVDLPLAGAARAVAAFRNCPAQPSV